MADFRAYLKPRPTIRDVERTLGTNTGNVNRVIGENERYNVMQPLHDTNGLLFPYTPSIMQFGGNANYDEFKMTHTNYSQPVYKNSEIRDIALSAKFTAQTQYEARYVLAMLKMMSNVTKMTFGERDSKDFYPDASGQAGLPPPILLFNYMGTHMFYDVPVVVTSYSVDLSDDVDYVSVYIGGKGSVYSDEVTHVPAELTLNLELKPYYNPKKLRQNFKLSQLANGDLVRGKFEGDGYDDFGSGYL
jgi:hypothetical protein